MINPSIHGWIDKFFIEQKTIKDAGVNDVDLFYENIRKTGFIYGHIISFSEDDNTNITGWLNDEISKVALLNGLYQIFKLTSSNKSTEHFIKQAVAFYNEMNPQGFNLFKKVLPNSSVSINLEKIIDDRVQTNDNIISKNFTNWFTARICFIIVHVISTHMALHFIYYKYKPIS